MGLEESANKQQSVDFLLVQARIVPRSVSPAELQQDLANLRRQWRA
jgi:hypothetical protein